MTAFAFEPAQLDGAFLIDCFSTGDARGGFTKSFEREVFRQAGIPFSVDETFSSVSGSKVIRGLHFQTRRPQSKLVTVLHGAVWDVVVDLRLGSSTFGEWESFELSADNHRALYVPRGFAHGFASLAEGSVMLYQCDGRYDAETDTGIRFDDPSIGIAWPIGIAEAVVSSRDLGLQSLDDYLACPMEL